MLLRNLFYAINKATNQVDFIQALNDVKVVDKNAYKRILNNNVTCWLRNFFKTNMKSDHITNNMSESFNQW